MKNHAKMKENKNNNSEKHIQIWFWEFWFESKFDAKNTNRPSNPADFSSRERNNNKNKAEQQQQHH